MIPLIALSCAVLVAFITYLRLPIPAGAVAATLAQAQEAASEPLPAWRAALVPLHGPVSRFTPAGWIRQARADLYWANVGGKWNGWDAVEFWALRIAATALAFFGALLVIRDPVFSVAAGFVGFVYPAMRLGADARRTRRRFLAELPEFIQLIAAEAAAGAPLQTTLERASRGESLCARWFRLVLQQAQGGALFSRAGVAGALRREAEGSLLPELIGLAVQLDLINLRGTHTQELLDQLATQIAVDYLGTVEQRAERIGTELVLPMVLFYFLPFLVAIFVVLGYPIAQGLL